MKPVLLLIIDDEMAILSSLQRGIRRSSIANEVQVEIAVGGKAGLLQLKNLKPQILLIDMKMPDISGQEIIQKIIDSGNHTYTIIMTGYTDIKEAVKLIKQGIYDYLTKPFELEELEVILKRIINELNMEGRIISLQRQLSLASHTGNQIISNNSTMKEVEKTINAVRDTDFNILILGESGTGKELIADLIHYSGQRRNGPLIKVNCAGLVSTLLESEMFGHEKGAFTDAIKAKEGKFSLANGGTLFLDEIGDMDIALQAKLLRTIQDGVYQKVGGVESLHTDARIVAATNRNLMEYIKEGKFREDLYYRLNVVTINLPALRERKDDIPLLALHFLKKLTKKYGKKLQSIQPEAIKILEEYYFPGNIRELENIITRSYISSTGSSIVKADLPLEIRENTITSIKSQLNGTEKLSKSIIDSNNLKLQIENTEREHIQKMLALTNNDRKYASELMGLSRRQLYNKISKYNL
ncbi:MULTISPECIES: sigma-54 dependent transcriptional regulator [unclassified Oceanispirochaeta]|uniref:sigma-54-dependent transcriptional regulator n=1 Tax=unclassified Oceanispirochaeta TaxID=2635722 RepID=UPI000E09AB9A|nr:sigma-54 dependent transcriptional regulator [Oceanispirochaeta sp. M1]MBF9018788.1 sigma-54-dependent Fis family transcriptional regulator [Oceanispirochaeta sp. M2]MBI9109468.1 sigma-54-dependent Fis family transcriptional regulator [Spirochaetales bacterium]NPD75257.1 sigma-54-dependent Fis family transcriptional regulator [Oceanispirochaeta sp. M1]RDG28893.1 sigma-54-dependent Fis family transcriptional regulator [Oceanispirochaeta sp. M1]